MRHIGKPGAGTLLPEFHSALNAEAASVPAARRAGSHADIVAAAMRVMAATAIEIGSAGGTW